MVETRSKLDQKNTRQGCDFVEVKGEVYGVDEKKLEVYRGDQKKGKEC